MSFKVTVKAGTKQESYSKVYLKLIGLEFNTKKISKAKDHFKSVYKSLCLDLTGREWVLEEDKVIVQTCDLFEQPNLLKRIEFDDVLTLIYSKEEFRIKDEGVIRKAEEYVKKLD